jgi:hypothetical protein
MAVYDFDFTKSDSPWVDKTGASLPQTPQDLWEIIGNISFGMDPGAKILWRGMSNYTWGVESSLIRALRTQVLTPTENRATNAN